jgi:glutaredoxin
MELNYTIYTKPKCTFCDKIKELLKDVSSTWVDCSKYLTNDSTKQIFLQFIADTAKLSEPYKTFPMVFCNGRFIGGYTETKTFHEKNIFNLKRDF